MLHEPAGSSGPDPAEGYKSRLGVWMFVVYALIYAGFVAINVIRPTAMENTVRRPYRGAFADGGFRHVVVRGTYTDKGGYISEDVTLDFTNDQSGRGHSSWTWSDGWLQCGGEFRFTLTKDPSP